jgi:hypothetical protein
MDRRRFVATLAHTVPALALGATMLSTGYVQSLSSILQPSPAWAAGPKNSVWPSASIDPAQVKVGGEIGRRIELTIQKNLLVIEVENQFLNAFRQKQSQPMA